MTEWRIRQSSATTTPSGKGFIVYVEIPSNTVNEAINSSPPPSSPTYNNNNNINNNNFNNNHSSASTTANRARITCLSETGNHPLATVEHTDAASAVVCDFLDDEHNLTTWLCVLHKEEHLDSIGRSSIGKNASVMTSYPIGEGGDTSPRISPLFGIRARAARAGVTGCYIFGTPPPQWKVPLASRAVSVTGQWVGQPLIPITNTSMAFNHQSQYYGNSNINNNNNTNNLDLMSAMGSSGNQHPFANSSGGLPAQASNIIISTTNSPHHQQHSNQQQNNNISISNNASVNPSHHHNHHTVANTTASSSSLPHHNHPSSLHHLSSQSVTPIHAWCLLTPYTVIPVFLCGTPPGNSNSNDTSVGASLNESLQGSVLLEFTIAGGVTVVVFMTLKNVIYLFAVECAAGGEALIWHVIPGECHHFVGDDTLVYGKKNNNHNNNLESPSFPCDEIQCEAIPSKDPLRCILALKFPRSQSVVFMETPPLRTESPFFPLDQALSHHQPQQHNDTSSKMNSHNNRQHATQNNNNAAPTATTTAPSSRSASQITHASATSSVYSNTTSHHPSVSPQRCEFCILERFSSSSFENENDDDDDDSGDVTNKNNNNKVDAKKNLTTSYFSFFKWSPVSAGASLTSFAPSSNFFVPFFGLVTTTVSNAQNNSTTTTATSTLTIFARGTFPRTLDKLVDSVPIDVSCLSSSSSSNCNNNVIIDETHITQACPLLGSHLLVRDKQTACWKLAASVSGNNNNHVTLPVIRANSVEFMSLCVLMSVLPQHADDLYRYMIQEMFSSSSSASSCRKDDEFFFDTLKYFLLGKQMQQKQQQEKFAPLKPKLVVFSPWAVGKQNSPLSSNNTNAENNGISFAYQHKNPAPKTIDPVSLQVATFTLHLLAESLRIDRLYLNNLILLTQLILSLASSCGLTNYTQYYQEALFSVASRNNNNADSNVNNNNNVVISDDDHQMLLITLRQFFDGIIINTNSNNITFDARIPLDLISSLRWMHEGLQPFVSRWPTLKSYNTSSSSSSCSSSSYTADGSSIFVKILEKRDPFKLASDIFHFVLSTSSTSSSSSPTSIIEKVVDLGWTSNFIETRLPVGVARSVYQAIAFCGDQLSTADQMMWRPEAVDLIGRHDILLAALNQNANTSSALGFGGPAQQRQRQRLLARAVPPERRVQRDAILFSESLSRHVEACASGSSLAQVIETEAPAGPFSQVKTERIHHLLSATSPIPLPAGIDPTEAVGSSLPLLVRRAVAVSVGRGMLNLATHNFRERDRVPVPPLVLTGLTADGLVINCEPRMISAEVMKWPTFHNACAAALRFLPLPNRSKNANRASPIARHWIVHQARDTQHRAGVLLAVGLLGHLSQLQLTDVYSIFVAPSAQDPQREPLTIAMLLGLGSSFRKTRSEAVFRCLAVHIHSLTPNGEDVEVSLDVQSAALIALGLVFEGAGQSFLVDMLLHDMSRPPSDQINKQREGYSLASGIALGLLLLGHGRNHNLAHLGIEERLLAFLEGGKRDNVKAHLFRPDSVYSDVTESVPYAQGDEKFLTRALVSQARVDLPDPCNTVSEGNTFNTQITGPAAAIALGLMFMKTRDEWIARHLDLPNTLPLLDAVTPQLSMLRVLCAGLIRWKTDHPPKDITTSCSLPQCLLKLIPQFKTNVSLRELDTQAQYRALHLGFAHAGAALAIGMTFAGTLVASVKSLLLAAFEGFAKGDIGSTGVPQPMIQKKSHTYDPCLASTAIAVALVSAGTGDADVLAALSAVLQRTNFTYGTYMAISSAIGLLFLGGGRCTLSNSVQSVAALLLAFYPQWPQSAGDNTFHLQALRHFYSLSVVPRWLSTFDVETGRVVTTSARLVMNNTQVEAGLEVSLARPDRDVTELVRMWTPIPSEKLLQQQQQKSRKGGIQDENDDASSSVPPRYDIFGGNNENNNNNNNINMSHLDDSTDSISELNNTRNNNNNTSKNIVPPSLAVVTPCLLPEISNIDRVEIKEPGYFNLTLWNSSSHHSSLLLLASRSSASALGVKKKPQLFFGNSPQVFGAQSWDAAIRDALVVYNGSKSLSSLQDLSLLCTNNNSNNNENNNGAEAQHKSSSSSIHVVSRLAQNLNQVFVNALFGENQYLTNVLKKMIGNENKNKCLSAMLLVEIMKNSGNNQSEEEVSLWLNHALHYSGLNIWWNDRFVQFGHILSGFKNNNEVRMNSLVDAAGRGRFGVEVVTATVLDSN